MSNPLAIAAVTATLRNLLMQVTADLPDATVTTKPPNKARNSNENGNQLNLFLYQTTLNAAWHKKKIPNRMKVGERKPPLALNLYYFITAYGRNDEDILSHRLLGQAMRILHEHSVFSGDEIKVALPGNDLHQQVEQVRITPQPLSSEELSKLWNIFQTPYALSVAYQVSVVLIESRHRATTTLPEGQHRFSDRSSIAQPKLLPLYPTLTGLQPPNQQSSVQPSDILTLHGHHLDGDRVVVRFRSLHFTDACAIATPLEGNATTIKVQLPTTPTSMTSWPVGFGALAAAVARAGEPERTTNELPFSLAPRIGKISPNPATQDSDGNTILTLTCNPPVLPEQQAILLLGDREILAQPHPVSTDTLKFLVTAVPSGDRPARLRVDGIDSLTTRTVTLHHCHQNQEVSVP